VPLLTRQEVGSVPLIFDTRKDILLLDIDFHRNLDQRTARGDPFNQYLPGEQNLLRELNWDLGSFYHESLVSSMPRNSSTSPAAKRPRSLLDQIQAALPQPLDTA